MKNGRIVLTIAVLAGLVVVGVSASWDRFFVRSPALNAAEPEAKDAPKPAEKHHQADRDGVQAAVKYFVTTFDKGDAKGLADLWTEEGEYVSDDGVTLQGRAALEDGYSQFFKKNPDVRLDMNVDSVSFISHDSAVMEGKGILRGNYYDALSDSTLPVFGSVDKKTQRAAWTVGDRKETVYETGIGNLLEDETTMRVHFGKDRTQQWALIRLEEQPDQK